MRLEIPLVLPGVHEETDRCVARLSATFLAQTGIECAHALGADAAIPPDAVHAPISNLPRFGGRPRRGTGAGPAPGTTRDVDSGARATLCVHYDPRSITAFAIADLAVRAGRVIGLRYGHALITMAGSTLDPTRVRQALRSVRGITDARGCAHAPGVAVEFDRTVVAPDDVLACLRPLDAGATFRWSPV